MMLRITRRAIRATLVVVGTSLVWVLARYVSPWAAGAVSFVALTVAGSMVSRKAPSVVERLVGSEPLNAAVGADRGFYSDGWSLALPADLRAEDRPPEDIGHEDARNHLFQVGAYDVGESHLLLTLEGRSEDTVRITGLRSRVLSRLPPLEGATVVSPSAGEQRIVAGYFNLDKDEDLVRGDEGTAYFNDWTLTLGRGETFMFQLIGRVTTSSCRWELVVEYTHRGQAHDLTLDAAGEPFRTAAVAERVGAEYEWAWYEQPPRLIRAPRLSSPE